MLGYLRILGLLSELKKRTLQSTLDGSVHYRVYSGSARSGTQRDLRSALNSNLCLLSSNALGSNIWTVFAIESLLMEVVVCGWACSFSAEMYWMICGGF